MASSGSEPPVWLFYATAKERPAWVSKELQPKRLTFWRHGAAKYVRGGVPYGNQLVRGASIVFLVGEEILATGVLAAGGNHVFADEKGARWWPIVINDSLLQTPISRKGIESLVGQLVGQEGSVRPLSVDAVHEINSLIQTLQPSAIQLPYPLASADDFLSRGDTLQAALVNNRQILPDAATATLMGWKGRRWVPPPPAPSPPEQPVESAPDVTLDQEPGQTPPPEAESTPGEGDDSGRAETVYAGIGETSHSDEDGRFSLISDAPSEEEDRLDRGPYALFLARRLHLIWCRMNGCGPQAAPAAIKERRSARPDEGGTFILHVDAPWGGGKTTFANFLARVLRPRGETLNPGHFLYSSLYAGKDTPPLDQVFVPDFATTEGNPYPDARRPWVIARYNAWRDQYVQPPWWQIFNTIQTEIRHELWDEAWGRSRSSRFCERAGALLRWAGVRCAVFGYKLFNPKMRAQLLLWVFSAVLLLSLYLFGGLDAILHRATISAEGVGKAITGVVAVLGFGGVSIAALLNVLTQSFNPDLDFSAEARQVGVQDPISRFRKTFDRILRLVRRPVLLIVDDIDRCDPASVVEVMRGFQTIVRSTRLFVLLLGDRAWIEAAHDKQHAGMAGIADPEGTLGSLFVRKMIQLSFRLPLMSRTAQQAYTDYILRGEQPPSAGQPTSVATALIEKVVTKLGETEAVSAVDRDKRAAKAAEEIHRDSDTAQQTELVDRMIGIREVATAGADPKRQAEIASALLELFAELPNNPRQMKRVVMAFGIYENVGRIYFKYRQTDIGGPEGALKARRWRQLARWVTLATEWPETWRVIARAPELLARAYANDHSVVVAESASEAEKKAAAIVERLRCDPLLWPILIGSVSEAVGEEAIDAAAVREFNRIIWEPGFQLEPALSREPQR